MADILVEGLTQKQWDALVEKFGKDAAIELGRTQVKIETDLNKKYEDVLKGSMTREDFDKYKGEQEQLINEKVQQINKLETALQVQGTELAVLKDVTTRKTGHGRSLEDYIEKEIGPKVKGLREAGIGNITLTGAQLKAADVTSIATSVSTMSGSALTSPYAPGLGGTDLELFDIIRNPNFVLNKVDLGRTNSSRLAWINETDYQGTPGTAVAEGSSKALTQHVFQVEYSVAKKAAAYIKITEEFDDDLPALATAVRRMLEQDVMRAFDDAIQSALQTAARPYEITGLTHDVDGPNKYDALGAMLAQVAYYNFIANAIGLNPVTEWSMLMAKNTVVTNGARNYLNPPFWPRLERILVEATKIAVGDAIVGDFKQYKVDIYKDFTLRVGWVNDDIIKNQFVVVGELRYHNYISDARKKALCYDQLSDVITAIQSGS